MFREQANWTDRREKGFLMQYSYKPLTLVHIHMPRIRSFNATQIWHQKICVLKIWGAFFLASRETTTSVTVMLKRRYLWGTEITFPEQAFLGGHIEKTVSPSASVFTHKKWRWSTFHHSENVHLFHTEFRLFWWEAALFKHWGPEHETLEKIPYLSILKYLVSPSQQVL